MKSPLCHGVVTSFVLLSLLTCACGQRTLPAAVDPKAPLHVPAMVEYPVDGVALTLYAEHPQIMTPTGIDVDDQGRVWAVACHTHFRPGNYPGPPKDEVLILVDQDKDGRADQRIVFYQKTEATMDLELGPDGWVYLAERDRILRIKDTDGDNRADQEQQIAVLDTTEEYPHNALSGMAWHPDGDLIFGLGENYWQKWTLTGTDGAYVAGTGEGGVFRCKPDGSKLRRIAYGFWNPFGVCVRSDGAIFVGENDPGSRPPCRLLYVVEGGDYGYQRLFGQAPFHPFVCWNGELRGTLPMLHGTGEAPCGVAVLGGGVLVPSWGDHRIDFYPLKRDGAGFKADRITLATGSDFFRPTCIKQVSDYVYYLTDWTYGSYELHQRGRVWRLEIDPEKAPWFQPRAVQPLNEAAKLAESLRDGSAKLPLEKLFALARGDDPYLANAALQQLSRQADKWDEKSIRDLSAKDKASAAVALKWAKPKAVRWAEFFLTDNHEEVQFEALRWIAEQQLNSFKPAVERMLQRSDLSYMTFEACLATLNILNGNPRAGVNDPGVLLRWVNNSEAPATIRAYALRLLPARAKGLKISLLADLLAQDDEEVSFEAVRTLAANQSPEAHKLLRRVAADRHYPARQRAEAIVGLASQPARHLDLLIELTGDADTAVREEALRALRFASLTSEQKARVEKAAGAFTDGSDLLAAALHPESLKHGRPAADDLKAWRARLDSVDGSPDPDAGRRLFFHSKVGLCFNCHRHSGRGNVVGPDLSIIAERDEENWLLRSLLQPSRDVAPQFYPTAVLTEDGETFTGIMLRKGGRSGKEYYRDSKGGEQSFLKSDIVMRKELRTSLMPDGLHETLTDRELRDLLAFLRKR